MRSLAATRQRLKRQLTHLAGRFLAGPEHLTRNLVFEPKICLMPFFLQSRLRAQKFAKAEAAEAPLGHFGHWRRATRRLSQLFRTFLLELRFGYACKVNLACILL